MATEAQRQRAGDWFGKGQFPCLRASTHRQAETDLGIGLGEATLVVEAVKAGLRPKQPGNENLTLQPIYQ